MRFVSTFGWRQWRQAGRAKELSPRFLRGCGWLDSEHYDMDARAPGNPDWAEIRRPMLQALIEDRFKAAFHGETKELPVYFLTVAKNGSKLKGTSCLTPGPNERVPVERRCGN